MSEVKHEKETFKSIFLKWVIGRWSTATVVGVAIGAALFGVLMNYGGITIFTNTKLSTAYIIPVIVGGLFGAGPALLVGFLGNVFADFIGGWGYWFDWSIGNGIASFFIGLLPLYGARIQEGIFTVKQAVIFAIVSVLGLALAFGVVTPIFTLLIQGGELTITYAQAYAAVASNAAVIIIVGIPLLFIIASRNKRKQNLVEE